MINKVDVSYSTRNFIDDDCNSLCWNVRRAYVAQAWERMNRRGGGVRGGGRDGGRGYGRQSSLRNDNELNDNKGGGYDECQQEEHVHGQGG